MRPGNVNVGVVIDDEEVEGDIGIVVGEGMMRNGVPLMVVVEPLSPAGAPESGMVVGEG